MELLDYLKKEPRARERRNKNRAIGNIILGNCFPLYESVDKERMADMVGQVLSLDRKWRKILEDNPNLRGTDYDEKQILEEKKMLELDYEPDYKNNVAKLKTL